MSKNTLIFLLLTISTSLFFTGCAERGYNLTVTPSTQTVTAQITRDIRKKDNRTQHDLVKMKTKVKQQALREEQRRAYQSAQRQQAIKQYKIQQLKHQKALEYQKRVQEQKTLKKQRYLEEQSVLEDQKRAQKQSALENQKRFQEHKALVEQKRAQKQKLRAIQNAKRKQQQEPRVRKNIATPKEFVVDTKVNTIEKPKMVTYATAQKLNFKAINKIYHKFGTSEINGHIVYLSPAGGEVRLRNTKVYLLPVSAKIDNWYHNYYLKNRDDKQSLTVNYLNSVNLNLDNNFEFFGVAEGDYYIIIESSLPAHLAKNKKVYIAKKVNVGKYKKVMAVFSKKL